MFRQVLILASISATSAPALAQIKFESDVLVGRRWAEQKEETESGSKEKIGLQLNDVIVSGRIQPMQDLPFSVGPTISYSKFKNGELSGADASVWEIGLEAKGWYNFTTDIGLYGKGRYVAYSFGKANSSSEEQGYQATYKTDLKTEGFHLAAGTQYNITKNMALIAEIGYGVQMLRETGGSKEINVTALEGSVKEDIEASNRKAFNSKSILLGMNVSL